MADGASGALTETIQRLFRDTLSVEVAPETDVVATGLLDSLALVTLLFEIEQEFQIQIPFDTLEVDDFRTVQRIASFVAASGGA